MAKVKRYDVSAAIAFATGASDVSVKLSQMDTACCALVTEVEDNGAFEGTLLYIPGMSFKQLKVK